MNLDTRTRLEQNLHTILNNINEACKRSGRDPKEVTFLPVTKKHPAIQLQVLIEKGHNTFGESYTEEIVRRFQDFPDVKWHYIGHLHRKHTNKIVGNVELIHSIANLPLLEKVNFTADQKGIIQDVLLEVNVSGEDFKQGFSPEQVKTLFEEKVPEGLPNVNIKGLMTMAPYTEDDALIRPVFSGLKDLLDELNSTFGLGLTELSMGMTNDYEIAVEEGATIVRIGTAIFQ